MSEPQVSIQPASAFVRADVERRRQAWATAVPAGLLAAGVAGLYASPFGWLAFAAAMTAGFVAVAGFCRLTAA